jgi:hypothetical protein
VVLGDVSEQIIGVAERLLAFVALVRRRDLGNDVGRLRPVRARGAATTHDEEHGEPDDDRREQQRTNDHRSDLQT